MTIDTVDVDFADGCVECRNGNYAGCECTEQPEGYYKNCEECGAFNEILAPMCTECCFEFYEECPKCKGSAQTPSDCDCIPF